MAFPLFIPRLDGGRGVDYTLIVLGPDQPLRLYAAAVASSLSAGVLLLLSWRMSGGMDFVRERQDDWALALLGGGFVVIGLISGTHWWLLGLPLFLFTRRGWQAVRATLD